MKPVQTTIAGLGLFFGLASAQNAFAGFCNPPPNGEQEVEPGLMATYNCGQIHSKPEYAGVRHPSADPSACVKLCATRTPEGPCSWANNQCYFYNPGASSSSNSKAVTVVIRKDWDRLQEAYAQCKSDVSDCLNSQGNPGDENGIPEDDGPPGGDDGNPTTGLPDGVVKLDDPKAPCPKDATAVARTDGRLFTPHCRKTIYGYKRDGGSFNVQSLKECLDRIIPGTHVHALYVYSAKACNLLKEGGTLSTTATSEHNIFTLQ